MLLIEMLYIQTVMLNILVTTSILAIQLMNM